MDRCEIAGSNQLGPQYFYLGFSTMITHRQRPVMEGCSGFEPLHKGFADPCLTAWRTAHVPRSEGWPIRLQELQTPNAGLRTEPRHRGWCPVEESNFC